MAYQPGFKRRYLRRHGWTSAMLNMGYRGERGVERWKAPHGPEQWFTLGRAFLREQMHQSMRRNTN